MLCSQGAKFLDSYVPRVVFSQGLSSSGLTFLQSYVPRIMFPRSVYPSFMFSRVLCSQSAKVRGVPQFNILLVHINSLFVFQV